MFCEGENVLLIDDPSDDAELAAIMRLLLDDSTRQRMGEAARRNVLQHSFHRNVDQILQIYQEILDRRGGLPHGYRVLESRIGGASQSGRRQGSRLLDILGAGVKK